MYMTMGPNNLSQFLYPVVQMWQKVSDWHEFSPSYKKKIFPGWAHFADTAKLLTFEKLWPHISLQANIPFFSKSSREGKKKIQRLVSVLEKVEIKKVKLTLIMFNILQYFYLKTNQVFPIFAAIAVSFFTLPTVISICAQWKINGLSFNAQQATIWESSLWVNKVISH